MKSWTIRKKLVALVGLILGCVLAAGGIGTWVSKRLSADLESTNHIYLPAIRYMTLLDMAHDGLRAVVYRAIVEGANNNPNLHREIRDELGQLTKHIHEYTENLKALELSPDVLSHIDVVRPKVEVYAAQAGKMIDVALSGRGGEVEAHMGNFKKAFADLEVELAALGDRIESVSDEISASQENHANKLTWLMWGVVFFSLVVGITSSFLLIKHITSALRGVISQLRSESSEIRMTSRDLNRSAQGLSSSSNEQAAALQETASSIEEMNAMLKKSSENAAHSKSVAEETRDRAMQGKQTVDGMIRSIEEINTSNDEIGRKIEESNQRISDIVKVIQEIGGKTKIINDIVFQTKLLSFNASVEAARAGEHGKGFAVVAEEVGNLAQMSGNAAKEISDLLETSIRRVQSIVEQTKSEVERLLEAGRSKVQSGTIVARECGAVFEDMVTKVSKVTQMVSEITSAAQEQATGISEITRAMNQLDQVTHMNAGTSQEISASTLSLNDEAAKLSKIVETLQVLVEGASSFESDASASITPSTATPSVAKPVSEPVLQAFGDESHVKPYEAHDVKPAKSGVLPPPGAALMKTGTDISIPVENDPRFMDL